MISLKSFFRFSTKTVKIDINSIISGETTKSQGSLLINNYRIDKMANMLLYYYPISKKHFENEEINSEKIIDTQCSNENIEECINLDCCKLEQKRNENERKV